jgi:hypothetical protein
MLSGMVDRGDKAVPLSFLASDVIKYYVLALLAW